MSPFIFLGIWWLGILLTARFSYGHFRPKMQPTRCKCGGRDGHHFLLCYEVDPWIGSLWIVFGSILWPVAAVGWGLWQWVTFKPRLSAGEKKAISDKKLADALSELDKANEQLRRMGKL
jgi:hypothetical protein